MMDATKWDIEWETEAPKGRKEAQGTEWIFELLGWETHA